ncbi:MAG TPA: T9SS type A sorting domain-containing protein [Candidatus Kapabacteria bacterium]|nr:T9SS type A sorting domain-containing protein [Candidatus Kapabacteria bacterium]
MMKYFYRVDPPLLQFMKTGTIPLAIQSITPNPANGEVQINFFKATSTPVSYQVMDALGQMRLSGAKKGNAISLDVSLLPPGIYFFRATTDDGFAVTRKVVVVH